MQVTVHQRNAHIVQQVCPVLFVSPPQPEFGEGHGDAGEERSAVNALIHLAKSLLPPGCLT